jgi:hypothetical protein
LEICATPSPQIESVSFITLNLFQVEIGGVSDEVIDVEKEELALIVHRKFNVDENHSKPFRQSLKRYVEACNTNDANLK